MEQVNVWPHDLLTFASVTDLIIKKNPLPNWAKDSLTKAKIVVVRRGQIKNGLIPVGLRGYKRQQRLAGFLKIEKVEQIYHPDYFIKEKSWLSLPVKRQNLLPFKALRQLVPILKKYNWGVSGSLAYEMATGVKMVKQNSEHISDLDLIMPNLPMMSVKKAREFLKRLNQFGVHADVQVVHDQSGFSLEEYAQGRSQSILVKTQTGPILARNPWQAIQE